MRDMYRVFAKKLFGVKYERIGRSLLSSVIIFWALSITDVQIRIAPFILYLMTAAFTSGVMWQALSSADNAAYLKNMMMLPLEGPKFVSAYTGALGFYTLITKTCILLSAVFAVSDRNIPENICSILCAFDAILAAAYIFSLKKRRGPGLLWMAGLTAAILLVHNSVILIPVLAGNGALLLFYLKDADPYCFYRESQTANHIRKAGRSHCIWNYFFRYMLDHRNYLVNTGAMCFVACVLPAFFRQMKGLSVLPMGFAILSLNTPLCILLSCDPALEQAVRFLPGQRKSFCIPYCLFIFTYNILVDAVFLCSWKIQGGEMTGSTVLTAVIFALQSAIGSVLLEWFRPLRNWKIESDLWHHPRKYVVPAVMLIAAVLVGTVPWAIYLLGGILLVECMVLLYSCR